MQLSEDYLSAQGFGVDADGSRPRPAHCGGCENLRLSAPFTQRLGSRRLFVQAVFNVYEQFHLASGKTVWLPPDKGEGQHWNLKPGNPFNKPVKVHLYPASQTAIKLTLDQAIPPIEGTD